MKKKFESSKRGYIIVAVLAIVFLIIFVGYIISQTPFLLPNQYDLAEDNAQDSNEKVDDLYAMTNLKDLESNTGKPNYIDKRSGFVFHYPEGFEVKSHDDYLTLSSINKQFGVVMLLHPEYETTDGYYVYGDMEGTKNRITYDIGGREIETISYDVADDLVEENIGKYRSKVEKNAKVLLKNSDQKYLNVTFYHFVENDKDVCLGLYAFESAPQSVKDEAKTVLEDVANSLSLIQYQNAQTHEETKFQYNYQQIGNYKMPYPIAWNVYEKSNGVIIRPPMIEGERYQGCAIVYTELDAEKDSNGDIVLTPALYLDKMKSLFGDAFSLNPGIDNDKTAEYFQGDVSEAVFNGYKYQSSFPEISVLPANTHQYSTEPIIDRNGYCYYLVDGNKVIVAAFVYRPNANGTDMRDLSEYILNRVTK